MFLFAGVFKAALVVLAFILSASTVFAATDKTVVKRTGKHNMNIHTKVTGDTSREVVRGQITKVESSGITMDGEFFSFGNAKLQDEYEAPLSYADIYVGLTADVLYRYGSIEKITVRNLKRPLVNKDKTFIEQERARTPRGK